MKVKKNKIENWCIMDTPVENLFISEYMLTSPGEYVKVYLYGLMCANLGIEMDTEALAKNTELNEATIENAWAHWEDCGVIQREFDEESGEFSVEFASFKDGFFYDAFKGQDGLSLYTKESQASDAQSKQEAAEAEKSTADKGESRLIDEDYRNLTQAVSSILGRPLLQDEFDAVSQWLNDYKVMPEVILYAYTYCKGRNKDHYKYVGTVIRNWAVEGVKSAEDVEKYLAEADQRQYLYNRVFKALGFKRNPTEKEQKIMNEWFDELNCSLETVLEACEKTSGISNPNLNYVNKVLREWSKKTKNNEQNEGKETTKPISVGQVVKYYDYLRKNAEIAAEQRREEVFRRVPRIKEIEDESKQCSMNASKLMLSTAKNKADAIDKIKSKLEDLTVEKAFLLTENNFESDYLDIKYNCPKCRDTGITDSGEQCECFPQRMKEAKEWLKKQQDN